GSDGDFVLVLEDLLGWDNVDHLAGVSVERARICMEQLAGLHAWSLQPEQERRLKVFPSLDSPFTRDLLPAAFKPAWQIYRDKADVAIPSAMDEYVERFTELAPVAIEELSRRSMLMHGDIRADNMFFSGDELKVVD
ncbi:aminoglycoside phosphotransferase, partial [Mycobacterium sp. ITM-2017-0098]